MKTKAQAIAGFAMQREIPILGIAGLLGFLPLPALFAQPIPSPYAFRLTLPQYVSMSASNTAQGYRPISLDANGPTNSSNVAAVWINDGFTNCTAVPGMTRADYSNQVATLTGQGYRTLCVDAYGDYPNERYMAVWDAVCSGRFDGRHGPIRHFSAPINLVRRPTGHLSGPGNHFWLTQNHFSGPQNRFGGLQNR